MKTILTEYMKCFSHKHKCQWHRLVCTPLVPHHYLPPPQLRQPISIRGGSVSVQPVVEVDGLFLRPIHPIYHLFFYEPVIGVKTSTTELLKIITPTKTLCDWMQNLAPSILTVNAASLQYIQKALSVAAGA